MLHLVKVGVPSEVKNNEFRVAITPSGVHELTSRGHEVLVQSGAGVGSSIPDDAYGAAGAKVVDGWEPVWTESDMVLKVKEPIEVEYDRMQPGHLSLPNGQGLDYVDDDGSLHRVGVAPNELTTLDLRDPIAGTPWHKRVPARLEPVDGH